MGHLTASLIGNPRNGMNYSVTVYAADGREICWCGPYDSKGRDACVKLFVDAGWEGLVNTP